VEEASQREKGDVMSHINDDHFEQLREAMKNEPPDTPLGKAVARLREPFILGDGETFQYEKFVEMFVALRDALHELDPTISPKVPPFLLHPSSIANIFGIPLEKFNYQGGHQTAVDPDLVKQLKHFVALLETGVVSKEAEELNQREKDILEAVGDKTLKGEDIAPIAGYEYDGHFKAILARLVKRRILGNKHPGYYRL
jgi:hypothetical protein